MILAQLTYGTEVLLQVLGGVSILGVWLVCYGFALSGLTLYYAAEVNLKVKYLSINLPLN